MGSRFKVESIKFAEVLINTPICNKCNKPLNRCVGDLENPRLKCLNPFCKKFNNIIGRAYGEWIELGNTRGNIEACIQG
jgi:hypothetical protein|tara:strand:+ start:169 stop:405 length:237 start_codon:yes stop_codon:yes gene_type:complete